MAKSKPIPGYSNYEVSEDGYITNIRSGRDLQPTAAFGKYMKVRLYENGVGTTHQVHRLVAEAFLPDYDEGFEVELVDFDTLNCAVGNLQMGPRPVRRGSR